MDLILPIMFTITLIDGSWYRVIDSSILQDFFRLSQIFCHTMKKTQLRKDKKKNQYGSMIMLFENIAL